MAERAEDVDVVFRCACGREQGGLSQLAAEAVGWRSIGGSWRCPLCNGLPGVIRRLLASSRTCRDELVESYGRTIELELEHVEIAPVAGDDGLLTRYWKLREMRTPFSRILMAALRALPEFATAAVEAVIVVRQDRCRTRRRITRETLRRSCAPLLERRAAVAELEILFRNKLYDVKHPLAYESMYVLERFFVAAAGEFAAERARRERAESPDVPV